MAEVTSGSKGMARDEVERLRGSPAFDDDPSDLARERHLRTATTHIQITGLWLEFGVSVGTSTAVLAERAQAASSRLFGFDSFEGLPEEWIVSDDETWSRGAFSGRPSALPDNVELVPGLFQETLPGFLNTHPGQIAFAHVDCDLYSSTKCVLSELHDRLAVGTVLVFDELFNYERYYEHEMRALVELGQAGVRWRYVGHVPARFAASLVVTEVP
jgi:hypothetical protein